MQTLTGQFAAVAREAPDRVAIIYQAGDAVRKYTYGQLYRDSLAVAGWLQAQGVQHSRYSSQQQITKLARPQKRSKWHSPGTPLSVKNSADGRRSL